MILAVIREAIMPPVYHSPAWRSTYTRIGSIVRILPVSRNLSKVSPPAADAADAHPVAFADGSRLLAPSPQRSSFARTWCRRSISISLFTLLFSALWALLPVLLVVGWIVDRVRGKPVIARVLLFFAMYLLFEVLGVFMMFAFWVAGGTWMGASRHRLLRLTFGLQCFWLKGLFRISQRLFRWQVIVTGEDAVTRGNILFFIRHVSTADIALAGVFVSDRHGIALRYVLKSQLLWDPCMEIGGNRLPNSFVVRERGKTKQAVAEVVRLTKDLGPAEGVLIYPEGTRFTSAKRAGLLKQLEQKGDTEQLEYVRSLRHVLPPKLGGTLALLEHAETADVVFCVHSGFEKARSFNQFMAGALNNLTVRIHFWRVARQDIPEPRDQRIAWLHEQWSRVDAWVAENSPELSADGAGTNVRQEELPDEPDESEVSQGAAGA
jgi:1-acyl-sn-glycerol-3-phosphate acyltransferase